MAKAGSKKQRSSKSLAKGVPSKNGRRRSKEVWSLQWSIVEGVTPIHRGRRVRKSGVARGRAQLRQSVSEMAKYPDLEDVVITRW